MNISTLQYFISAAEYCNFTKAAQKHFVAQTAVSQQILKLEQELGVSLFNREKKRVVLTKEGQVFYKEIRKVLMDYEHAILKTKQSYFNQKKKITMGYTRQMDIELLYDTMVRFQEENPEIEIVIKEDTLHNLYQEVKHGSCDILLNMSVSMSENEVSQLCKYTYYYGNMLVALSKLHPKSEYKYLLAKELKDEKFVVLNTGGEGYGFTEMHEHCEQDGYKLQINEYVSNMGALFFYVELNRGVAFVQDRMKNPSPDRIKFLPIHNSNHKYGVDMIWCKCNENNEMKDFISFVKQQR